MLKNSLRFERYLINFMFKFERYILLFTLIITRIPVLSPVLCFYVFTINRVMDRDSEFFSSLVEYSHEYDFINEGRVCVLKEGVY